jgi:hypothetical protein
MHIGDGVEENADAGEHEKKGVVGVPPRVYSGSAAHLAAVMHISCMYSRRWDHIHAM